MVKRLFGYILLIAVVLFFSPRTMSAQDVVVKTNLLYGAYTFTPNLGLEIGLSNKMTLDISGGYNWFNLKGDEKENKKKVHWLVQPELRLWTCEKFNGHFFGLHLLGGQYNISKHKLPLLLGKDSQQYRYEGWAAGAGLSYGYQWLLSKRWSIEATIGAGYAYMSYDKYLCNKCGEKLEQNQKRHYVGPTKAGINIIYIIK